jgi:hypothetical protein
MCSIVNQSTVRKSEQSEVAISGRLANQNTGKKTIRKQDTKRNTQSTAETHTSFDMSRKSLNISLTLTQGDLLQEALAVTFARDQTQALNIPFKVPLGVGRYAELTEWQ